MLGVMHKKAVHHLDIASIGVEQYAGYGVFLLVSVDAGRQGSDQKRKSQADDSAWHHGGQTPITRCGIFSGISCATLRHPHRLWPVQS